mmetsp:Transcript_16758/g.48115  ORF Transcript_16758/g.48115 Transcript_16758/m.48115 type:complete len:249 (+) Transcript_16758:169-915(+)
MCTQRNSYLKMPLNYLLEGAYWGCKGVIDLRLTPNLPDSSQTSLSGLLAGIGGPLEVAHRIAALSHQAPPPDIMIHHHFGPGPSRRSVLLVVIDFELVRVVWVPRQLDGRSGTAGRIVAKDDAVFSNFQLVEGNVALRRVGVFGAAAVEGSEGAVAVVKGAQGDGALHGRLDGLDVRVVVAGEGMKARVEAIGQLILVVLALATSPERGHGCGLLERAFCEASPPKPSGGDVVDLLLVAIGASSAERG